MQVNTQESIKYLLGLNLSWLLPVACSGVSHGLYGTAVSLESMSVTSVLPTFVFGKLKPAKKHNTVTESQKG